MRARWFGRGVFGGQFKKWCPLGAGAIAVDQAGAAAAQLVADFKIGAPARYPILVISYELYRLVSVPRYLASIYDYDQIST